MKVVCLGNEFIEGDSLGVEVGEELKREGYNVLHIRDSFELMNLISEEKDFTVIDVVDKLKNVCRIKISDLRVDSILSAHDFDAGYVLSLLGKEVKIIGIPKKGNFLDILEGVKKLL